MKSSKRFSDPGLRALRAALLPGAALLLVACQDPDLLVNDRVGPGAAASRADVAGIDGLTVGHRLMAAEEYELALKAYYRAAAQIGLNVDVLSAIGSANLRLGRRGQAEDVLRRAIEADERFVPAWNNLGVVLYSQGELGEAREAFRTAFALDNGSSPEIRENFQRLDAMLQNVVGEQTETAEFRLVRRGNGSYLLLGNDNQKP